MDTSSHGIDWEDIIAASVSHVFGSMAFLQAEPAGSRSGRHELEAPLLTGIIGITGENLEGVLALVLPRQLAATAVANLVGMDADGLAGEDVEDGVCELTNMVSGQAKTLVSTRLGIHLSISLPTIVTGTHSPPSNSAIRLLCIDFYIQGSRFAAELAIQSS